MDIVCAKEQSTHQSHFLLLFSRSSFLIVNAKHRH
jgi:hypothetical protein